MTSSRPLSWLRVDAPLADAATACVTRSFLNGDALSHALSVPAEEFFRFVSGLLEHSRARGLSVAGLDPDGVPAAVGINTLLEDDFAPSAELCPTLAPVFAFLAELSDPDLLPPAAGRRRGHLWMAAVAPEHRGQGLLRQLLRRRLSNLREHGADDFVVEATHPHNIGVLRSLPGCVIIRSLAPSSFKLDGVRPFSGVPGDCAFLLGDVRLALESLSA